MTPASKGWFILGILLGMLITPILVALYRFSCRCFEYYLEHKQRQKAIKDMEDYVNND